MIVSCTQCETKFKVDDAKIGPRGVKVRCTKCQTMIIVRPPGAVDPQLLDTNPGQPPGVPPPVPNAPPPLPDAPLPLTSAQEAPTKVLVLDEAMRAALVQASAITDASLSGVGGGSFGLDPQAPPAGLPVFADHEPSEPTEPAFGAPKQAIDPGGGGDLFANPFGGVDPGVDPAAEAAMLEVDAPSPGQIGTLDAFDPNPDGRQLGGETVHDSATKPLSLASIEQARQSPEARPEARPVPLAQIETVEQRELTKRSQRPKNLPGMAPVPKRSSVARVGQIGMAAFLVSGFTALYLLYSAGGLRGLTATPDPGAFGDVSVERVGIAPYRSSDGRAFWIVRGEAHNRTSAPMTHVQIAVSLDGLESVTVPAGGEPDAERLFEKGEVAIGSGPEAMAPNERLAFVAVVPNVGDARTPPQARCSFSGAK